MVLFIEKSFNPYLSIGLWLPCMGQAAINRAGRGFRSFWRYLMVSAIKNVLTIGGGCYISTSRPENAIDCWGSIQTLRSECGQPESICRVLAKKLNIC